MKSQKGDKQLQKYVDRAGDGFVKGTEILGELDGKVINTNLLSENPTDFSGTITLHTDIENHPGMIFYSLDDGKSVEEKVMETVKKVVTTVAEVLITVMGPPTNVPGPTPIPSPMSSVPVLP